MSLYRAQLEECVSALHVEGPDEFYWFGKLVPKLPRSLKTRVGPQSRRNITQSSLQSLFYQNFFCRGYAAPQQHQLLRSSHAVVVQDHLDRLRGANAGTGQVDPGWTVVEGADVGANVVVFKEGLLVAAKPNQYRASARSTQKSDYCLNLPPELPAISPGFYMVLSDAPMPRDAEIRRFYWNVTPEGAVKLVSIATDRLNSRAIPFRLKALTDPNAYARRDAAVLYLADRDENQNDILDLQSEVSEELEGGGPAFTLELAGGLAFANDPGNGESFGMHCCSLIAEGVLVAAEAGQADKDAIVSRVEAAMDAAGISLDAPYLAGRGFSPERFKAAGEFARPSTAVSDAPETDHATWQNLADRIAGHLEISAHHHGRYCTWMGHVPKHISHRGVELAYRSLGPTLYDGVAGIALFLAEYAVQSGSASHRKLAIAAMRQAIRSCSDIERGERLGLYTGCVGTALAAAYTGLCLDVPPLLSAAKRVAKSMPRSFGSTETDLLAGAAGSVAGFVILADLLDESALLGRATALADQLIELAEPDGADGLAWPTTGSRGPEKLLGFSHGASGVAFALNELGAATGDTTYRDAARGGATYERTFFREKNNNWPDLRDVGLRIRSRECRLPMTAYWCHGAPGIAGARLRAAALFGDAEETKEAELALRTTKDAIVKSLRGRDKELCLCHGLAGNLDVLLYASRTNPGSFGHASDVTWNRDLADQTKAIVVNEVDRTVAERAGGQLGLFLGDAGLGYLALRLTDQSVPSVLFPDRDSFRRAVQCRT